jgi:hypothetical protein
LSRVVTTANCTVTDLGQSKTFTKGQVVEASAALVTALGSNARAATSVAGRASPSRDDTGENVAVSNSSA